MRIYTESTIGCEASSDHLQGPARGVQESGDCVESTLSQVLLPKSHTTRVGKGSFLKRACIYSEYYGQPFIGGGRKT